MSLQESRKYIPLNVTESAVLHDANSLLPRDEIYERLAELILDARDRAAEAKDKSLNELRAHNAISIDGTRGTGKTAVLVNLKRYLQLEHKKLLSDIHILEPIDPTLLEDGDSLFLHIVVAAVLHNDEIKSAQRENPELAQQLNRALDKLTHSLEGVDTQKDRYGIDKVRAMYGNKHLADCVQDFFHVTVRILGKKLLVLPIDDVDTSLNRAFENLEIIRRYLTTPYVLPIVSGDRTLYNEVTWRDFHGRLTKDSNYRQEQAYEMALELAEEYQRKILPFPRRLSMPDVGNYWQRADIYLRDEKLGDIMPLRNFIAWMEIFLMGPVNGQEDSRLLLPIPSIRSLTQLVGHCRTFIPLLPNKIHTAKNELEVRRAWQMPTVPLEAIAAFQDKHKELSEKKREYAESYRVFAEKVKTNSLVDNSFSRTSPAEHEPHHINKPVLTAKIADYFRFEPKAGAIYLILLAKQHWQNWSKSLQVGYQDSIFSTPLFQPLTHNQPDLALFDKMEDLSSWSAALADRLPAEWLAGLKSHKLILPYPIAEVGINASNSWNYSDEIDKCLINYIDPGPNPENNETISKKASFLISLLAQYNFYTDAKQTILLNIGRIFELIIQSIIAPVSKDSLQAILTQAPFFSTRALAPTKTIQVDDYEDGQENQDDAIAEDFSDSEVDIIKELANQINAWRATHEIDKIDLSPWLVYKVFNKVYSQISSSKKIPNGMKDVGTAITMVAQTFYATWSAFGSFEKGELFGLPNVVATINLNSNNLKNFEHNDLFNINLGPFAPTSSQINLKNEPSYKNKQFYGMHTRTISYCLAEHPMRLWIDKLVKIDFPNSKDAEAYLRSLLKITAKNLTVGTMRTALSKQDLNEQDKILEQMISSYGPKNKYTAMLHKAITILQQNSEQS